MNGIIKVFGVFTLFLMFYSCSSNYIALQDAEKGLFLDRSKKVSTQTFFNRRMDGELKSHINRNWFIVNEDLDYVYFGQLEKRNNIPMVSPFYKTEKAKLDSIFPGYRSIEGKHIKAKVFQSLVKPVLEERLMTLCPQSYQVDYKKRDYSLTKEGIETTVKFIGRCYEDRIFFAEVTATLNPQNLEIIDKNIKIR
ncbi:hypothetical protein KRX57_00705 [Weeksellaceae bacterium TAE3-ERU29]|nr:hypothetical protein [Weeksellaceae bacterium TAE3-ERU29]